MTWSRPVRKPLLAAAIVAPVLAVAAVGTGAALTTPNGAPAASTDTNATPSSTASTNGQAQDAHAIVVNHGDNRYRYALTLKVVQVGGDLVDPQNAAVAVAADCTDCETVAISLEGVLVYGDPSVFAPENIALAYNENCTNCATLAAAYQEVVQNSDRVRITGEGRRLIAQIRVDLESLRHENLPLQEIDDRVNADAAVLLQVLRNDVVPVGKPSASPSDTAGTASDAPTAATAPSTSGSSTSPAPSSTDTSTAPASTTSASPSATSPS